MTTQDDLRARWEHLTTTIYPVLDENGVNVANAQIRPNFDPHVSAFSDEFTAEPTWLYVDDVDGFSIVDDETGHRLSNDVEVKKAAFRAWNNRA